MNSKERSYLKKEASKLKPTLFIGKDGMNENILVQAENELKARELVKGKIGQNSLEDVRQCAEYIASKTESEVVITIGSVFVLYRQNEDKNQYGV